jgi:hypothetical protein
MLALASVWWQTISLLQGKPPAGEQASVSNRNGLFRHATLSEVTEELS